jgi:Tfp pilus assembly protein PilV
MAAQQLGRHRKHMRDGFSQLGHRKGGFSLLEMLFATLILLVGLVAVAQLVPISILLNSRNRNDSTALVFAQREMDQMLGQPLSATTFTDTLGIYCPISTNCGLGDPTQPNQVVGNPVVVQGSRALIDFTASTVTNYSFSYLDPNELSGATYDVRWAVITTVNGTNVTAKRIIVGVRPQGGNGYMQPITLDTMVMR